MTCGQRIGNAVAAETALWEKLGHNACAAPQSGRDDQCSGRTGNRLGSYDNLRLCQCTSQSIVLPLCPWWSLLLSLARGISLVPATYILLGSP